MSPDDFVCCFCDRVCDDAGRHGGRDTDPGEWCDGCATDPGWSVRRG